MDALQPKGRAHRSQIRFHILIGGNDINGGSKKIISRIKKKF